MLCAASRKQWMQNACWSEVASREWSGVHIKWVNLCVHVDLFHQDLGYCDFTYTATFFKLITAKVGRRSMSRASLSSLALHYPLSSLLFRVLVQTGTCTKNWCSIESDSVFRSKSEIQMWLARILYWLPLRRNQNFYSSTLSQSQSL